MRLNGGQKNILVYSCKLETYCYICVVKVETKNLQTIKNYAAKEGVTPSYIYKLAKENKMQIVNIDGVQFVNLKQYPILPTRKD